MTDERRALPTSAWVAVAVGWIVMGWSVAGVVGEQSGPQFRSWTIWLVGVAIVNDVVLVPLAVLVGVGLGRAGPAWRTPLRWGLVTVGIVGLATWPVVARYGATDDNPSLLPLPALRNLAFVAVVVIGVAVVGGIVAAVVSRRARSEEQG